MKITYEFDNGDVVIVEASERIGKWILASRRREASDDKYHHRYCYSLDAVNDKANITVVISDNLTTAMTGGQDSAGTNKFEAICLALGVEREHLHVVVPLPANRAEIGRIIREELAYRGVSVIIPQRECMQTLARKQRKKQAAK